MRHIVLPVIVLSLGLAACKQQSVDVTNEKPSAVASKVPAADGAGAIRFQPGRWETEVKMIRLDMPGMPPEAKRMMEQMMGKGRTIGTCLTKEQAEKPDSRFFGQADASCTYDHFSMGGGKIDAKMTCKTSEGQQVTTMKGAFTGDTYQTTVETQGQGPDGKSMTMIMNVAAKRVGECTGKEAG